MFDGVEWRGFGEPSRTIVIFSLSAGNDVRGFLVLGMNLRRPYDEGSQQFIQLLERQLSTAITSTVLIEQVKLSHARVTRQLAIRTREVAGSEARFKLLTELSPIGVVYLIPDGTVKYANDKCKPVSQSWPTDPTANRNKGTN